MLTSNSGVVELWNEYFVVFLNSTSMSFKEDFKSWGFGADLSMTR